jgi:hypothetical protein
MMWLLTLLSACGDDQAEVDPDSAACIAIRKEYLRRRELRDIGASQGADPALVRQADYAIDNYRSEHWGCFE